MHTMHCFDRSMSEAPSGEKKDEPHSGVDCVAGTFMKMMAELLYGFHILEKLCYTGKESEGKQK